MCLDGREGKRVGTRADVLTGLLSKPSMTKPVSRVFSKAKQKRMRESTYMYTMKRNIELS